MNPQEIQQVAARDEKWVPFTERVKINSTNVRLESTMPQKEETFQVVIDLTKNSSCFKAFTISADIPEIFMHQFWNTIKKVQGTDSYEFLLANKKCVVNADVFRTILDIFPRVEGVDFNDVPDNDDTLAFLIKLGYKGPLYKHTKMFVNHMHQPWRTLAAIINKCLFGKIASNDKLRKSIIDILWGMFYRENVDNPKLIWEDLAFQIDHKNEKRSRHENIVLPNVIKYSTGQIPPKKSKGKGSQRKKTADNSQETVDVSEESEPKPKPVKRKTTSRLVVKKKVTISADDNIISDDPDVALELGKSISKIEAGEAEATRQVHATHARIVNESVPKLTRRRKSGKVTFDPPKKLKGVPSLTPEEQKAADTMQALKESRKTSRRQPGIGGSNEGTGTIPRVINESTVIFATSSEGIGTKPGVPDEEKVISEEKVILEWGSEQESEYSKEDQLSDEEKDEQDDDTNDEGNDYIRDNQDDDDEDDETESDEDEIYKFKIRVRKDADEDMLNAEVEYFGKCDVEVSDAAKADAEKTEVEKDDSKKAELPPTSSSLSISSDAEISSLLDIKIQSEVLHIQSPSVLKVHVFVISEPSILTPVQETPSAAPVTTLPPPSVSTIPPTPLQQNNSTNPSTTNHDRCSNHHLYCT
ncbi:hypothetical protein Tco_1415554 [Tanacetum coccineum]